jgi:hypothetical protein
MASRAIAAGARLLVSTLAATIDEVGSSLMDSKPGGITLP